MACDDGRRIAPPPRAASGSMVALPLEPGVRASQPVPAGEIQPRLESVFAFFRGCRIDIR